MVWQFLIAVILEVVDDMRGTVVERVLKWFIYVPQNKPLYKEKSAKIIKIKGVIISLPFIIELIKFIVDNWDNMIGSLRP